MSLLDNVFAMMTREATLLATARKRLALVSGTGTKCFFTVKFWDPSLVLSRDYLAKNCRSTSVERKEIKVELKVKVL